MQETSKLMEKVIEHYAIDVPLKMIERCEAIADVHVEDMARMEKAGIIDRSTLPGFD